MQLTLHKWAHRCTLFEFKFTVGPIGSNEAKSRSYFKSGNVRLKLSVAQPTPANLTLILMYQSLIVLNIVLFNNEVMI